MTPFKCNLKWCLVWGENKSLPLFTAKFLQLYFDFSYFLLFSPFRLKSKKRNTKAQESDNLEHFEIHTSLIQSVPCFIVTIFGIPYILRDVRISLPPKNSKRPATYFLTMLKLVNGITKALTLKKFWWSRDRQEILQLVNFVTSAHKELHTEDVVDGSNKSNPEMLPTAASLLFCLIYAGMALMDGVSGRGLLGVSGGTLVNHWSLHSWWTVMLDAGKYNLFLEHSRVSPARSNKTSLSSEIDLWDYSVGEYVIGVTSAIGWFQRYYQIFDKDPK